MASSAIVPTLLSDAVPVDGTVERDRYCTPILIPSIVASTPAPPPPSTWTAFLASLPLWECSLFPDVIVLDLPALLSALANNADLYFAPDGGAIPSKGSFSAAILVECGGRAYRQDPWSFRSEAYGMLAITRLLLYLRRYHHYNSHV
jgi:hypothetical protein